MLFLDFFVEYKKTFELSLLCHIHNQYFCFSLLSQWVLLVFSLWKLSRHIPMTILKCGLLQWFWCSCPWSLWHVVKESGGKLLTTSSFLDCSLVQKGSCLGQWPQLTMRMKFYLLLVLLLQLFLHLLFLHSKLRLTLLPWEVSWTRGFKTTNCNIYIKEAFKFLYFLFSSMIFNSFFKLWPTCFRLLFFHWQFIFILNFRYFACCLVVFRSFWSDCCILPSKQNCEPRLCRHRMHHLQHLHHLWHTADGWW